MEEVLRQCLLFAKSRNNTVKNENNLSIDEQLRKDVLEFALSIACIDDKLDTQEIITIGNILDVAADDEFKSTLERVKESKGEFL